MIRMKLFPFYVKGIGHLGEKRGVPTYYTDIPQISTELHLRVSRLLANNQTPRVRHVKVKGILFSLINFALSYKARQSSNSQ